MSYITYERVLCSATSSGSVTTLSTGTYTGFVHAVYYNPVLAAATSSGNISSGGTGTIAITAAVSGLPILTLANASSANMAAWYPRNAHTATLTSDASTGAAMVPLRNERIQIAITSGSTTQDTKYANVDFYIS